MAHHSWKPPFQNPACKNPHICSQGQQTHLQMPERPPTRHLATEFCYIERHELHGLPLMQVGIAVICKA